MNTSSMKTRDYTHIKLNEEVQAIGGYYILEKEVRLSYKGEEVLYVIGMSLVDNSCCAVTGCKYAIVPGYILDWRYRTKDDGLPVTEVQPVRDPEARKEIESRISEDELVQHVEFH